MNEHLVQIGTHTFRILRNTDGTYKSEVVPEKEEKPEMESLPLPLINDSKLLAVFPSESSPGDRHRVKYSTLQGIYCTCTGFGRWKHCWHYDSIIGLINDGKATLESLIEHPMIMTEDVLKWLQKN